MSLGDPAFGPSYTRACEERAQLAAIVVELIDACSNLLENTSPEGPFDSKILRTCEVCQRMQGAEEDQDKLHADDCLVPRARELLGTLELPPVPRDPKRVRLVVEVDMTDDADWNVGIVPGSGDSLPPNEVLSTILTYVARQHTTYFTNAPDIDEEE